MKKLLVLSVMALATVSCSKEKGSANTAENRAEFIKECVSSAKNQAMASNLQLDEKIITDYCSCSAEKILNQLTEQDLVKLGTGDQELMNKSQEYSKVCLEEFTKKMQEAAANAAAPVMETAQ